VTQALAGLVVVVTRPARQAARFIGLLAERGATAVAFPTIAIEPVPLEAASRAALATGSFDWIVYTSGNAVEHAPGAPGRAKTAAIGRATARALQAAGIPVDALPASGADSEGVLALPEFRELHGTRILIVKGVGGREALRSGLEDRGATVVLAEVYRRVPVVPAPGAVDDLRRAGATRSPVVAVTSVEVLESLLRLAPEERVPELRDTCLLVPGGRVAAAAARLGWRGPVAVARSAEDEAMLQALLERYPGNGPHAPA
jgi:uroporphyrinogen-III synthase